MITGKIQSGCESLSKRPNKPVIDIPFGRMGMKRLCGLMLFCVVFWYDLGLDIADNLFLVITAAALMIVDIICFAGKTGQMSDAGSSILIFRAKGVEKRHTAFLLLS